MRDHAHSRSTWAENIENIWLPRTNMGKLQSAINSTQRRESTIPAVKCLQFILHMAPKSSTNYLKSFFFKRADTLSRKIVRIASSSGTRFIALSDPISVAVEPFNSSLHCCIEHCSIYSNIALPVCVN